MIGERELLLRRGRILEVFTVLWTLAEAVAGLLLGVAAGSVALVGFGLDGLIEMGSGLVLLWRLQTARDAASAERAEATALRVVGVSLLAVAAYVFYASVQAVVGHETPAASPAGIILAILTLVAMPLLARGKRRVAKAIHSHALRADAFQATVCTYLSAILLGGLLLNVFLGWWWADPIAAFAMTPFIVKEGLKALRGERCQDCGIVGHSHVSVSD